MNDGWISLHRKLLDNPIVVKDADHLAIWIYLLLNATHTGIEMMFMGKRVTLNPGQLITGRKSISAVLNINESKTQRVLKTFENEHQIEQQTSNKNRLITILNWNYYQNIEQQTEQQLNNNRTTTEQQLNTNNKDNKDNKDNKVNKRGADKFDFSICEKEFEPIIREWIEYKVSRKENYANQNSFSKMYKNLHEYSSGNFEIAQRIVDRAMGNNWKGIFPFKPGEMISDVDLKQAFIEALADNEWVQNFNKNNKISAIRIKELLSEYYRILQNQGAKSISVDKLKYKFYQWYQKEVK